MSNLVQVTVNLPEKTHQVLEGIAAATGDTKTDSISRAILVYGRVVAASTLGSRFVFPDRDGALIEVRARRVPLRGRRWWWFR